MPHHLRKTAAIVALALFLGFIFFLRFYKNHLDLPGNCDEFGYLMMAEGISEGNLFGDHIDRDYNQDLSEFLTSNNVAFNHYAYMLSAYAYHNEKSSNKIINQYPPGTSLLLAPFPKIDRKVIYPMVCGFLMAFFALVALFIHKPENNILNLTLVSCISLIFIVSAPFLTEFARIGSVAPTFGPLLAAGILFKRNILFSIALIGFCCLFRVASIVLFVPLFLYYLIDIFSTGKINLIKLVQPMIYLMFGGFAFYLLYVFLLLGNPFLPTYSPHDIALSTVADAVNNIRYYFNFSQKWFVVQLVSIFVVLIFWKFKLLDRRACLLVLSAAFINYLFFVYHWMAIPYYPYASSIISIGVILAGISDKVRINQRAGKIALISALAVVALPGILHAGNLTKDHRNIYNKELETYMTCIGEADVVWADIKTTTVEYATEKPGFKFHAGTPQSIALTIEWLYSNRYNQTFWLDELNNSEVQIISYAESRDITYKIEDCELGRFLFIRARP